jgi:hypothetical protein
MILSKASSLHPDEIASQGRAQNNFKRQKGKPFSGLSSS